jgi:hypothetical protein
MHVRKTLPAEMEQAAAATLTGVLNDVGLPVAQEAAPGSISNSIFVVPVQVVAPGHFTGGLKVVGYGAYVNQGTGEKVGHDSWTFGPRTAEQGKKQVRALELANGTYRASVTIHGQAGQHFLQKGVRAARRAFNKWFRQTMSKQQ